MTDYAPAIPPEHFCNTERHRTLARFQSYFDGKQYDGRPDFWTGKKANGDVVPLRERAPCIVYPLPRNAVREVVRFTFGEGRFPGVGCKAVEADQAIGGLELSEDDAKLIESTVAELVTQARLRLVMRSLLTKGCVASTAVAILCIRDGRFVVDIARSQDCLPKFKRDGDPTSEVNGLTWCYQYDRTIVDRDGRPKQQRCFFRRDVTEAAFVDYEPAIIEPGKDVQWVAKAAVPHGFSFCPVRWIRHLPEEHSGELDGTSMFDGNLDEFDALNFALSQRHRGITYFGTPQPYETGVAEGDGPSADGRKSGPAGYSPPVGAKTGAPFDTYSAAPARQSAPDKVWSYSGDKVTVGLIETSGASFDAATKHVNDISSRLKEAMGVVLANAVDTLGKGDMSAKFLALVYAPLLALVDDVRECWWVDGLGAILSMMLRAIAEHETPDALLLPNAKKSAEILRKRFVAIADGSKMWVAPKLEPLWGAYFSPSNGDVKDAVDVAVAAKAAKLIGSRDATAYIADDFGIKDVDAAVEDAELPTLDDVLLFNTAGFESELLRAEFMERAGRRLTPGLDEAEREEIDRQLGDAAEQHIENKKTEDAAGTVERVDPAASSQRGSDAPSRADGADEDS